MVMVWAAIMGGAIKTEDFFRVQINYKYDYFHLKEEKSCGVANWSQYLTIKLRLFSKRSVVSLVFS